MSERMDTQAFMDRMRNFVADEPDSLSMEMVAMCATMIEWSKPTTAIVRDDFIGWIITLRNDTLYCQNDKCATAEDLDDLLLRAINVCNTIAANNRGTQNDER